MEQAVPDGKFRRHWFFLSGTRPTYMESFGDTDFSLKARRLTWCG